MLIIDREPNRDYFFLSLHQLITIEDSCLAHHLLFAWSFTHQWRRSHNFTCSGEMIVNWEILQQLLQTLGRFCTSHNFKFKSRSRDHKLDTMSWNGISPINSCPSIFLVWNALIYPTKLCHMQLPNWLIKYHSSARVKIAFENVLNGFFLFSCIYQLTNQIHSIAD